MSLYALKTDELVPKQGGQEWVEIFVKCGISVVIRKENVCRMWAKYKESRENRQYTSMEVFRCQFNMSLSESVQRRLSSGVDVCLNMPGKVALYTLWKRTSSISVELFADALTESGVCKEFCDTSSLNNGFGGLRPWSVELDSTIMSGGATPANCSEVITDIIETFEDNVCREEPYCRTAFLPLDGPNGVNKRVQEGLFGALLLEVPLKAYGTVDDNIESTWNTLLSCGSPCAGSRMYGLFVWNNRSYVRQHRPPMNVEKLYSRWVCSFVCTDYVLHEDAFRRVFPEKVRVESST